MSLAEELRSRNFSEYLDSATPNLNLLILAHSRHLWTMVSLSRYLPTSCALCELEYCRRRALGTLLEWLNGVCYLVWWPFNHSPKNQFRIWRRDRSNERYRTGVLCIILCLALGIANIFSFNLLLMILSGISMWVAFISYQFIAKPNLFQSLGIRNSLHWSTLPPPNLSHIPEIWCLYPPLYNQLDARPHLRRPWCYPTHQSCRICL